MFLGWGKRQCRTWLGLYLIRNSSALSNDLEIESLTRCIVYCVLSLMCLSLCKAVVTLNEVKFFDAEIKSSYSLS